ncbi:MAG: hypothetical protein ABIR98_01355 [Usitatibacter sp.]
MLATSPLLRVMSLAASFLLLLIPLAASAASLPGFDELERALRLNPHQKQQFDVAVNATQRAMVAIGLGALQAKTRVTQELLKERPDPDALFMAQEELIDFAKPHMRGARDEWLRLYALMDDDQVRIARAFIEDKLRRLEAVGEHLGRSLSDMLPKPK